MKTVFFLPPHLSTSLAAFGICVAMNTGLCRADSSSTVVDTQGVQELTRGPVHEAFAGVITYKPVPGMLVSKAPPENIEEIPPDQKPEGNNVTWIPGYWAWDDERNDFLWVSGVWRALPPGREWVPGYWAKSGEGYQWTSGYWADASDSTTTYLPEPPATIENGPNVAAPADDYEWIPGCWVWLHGRYVWRPGYWIEGQANWDWNPDYYVWTPHGFIFVDGFWDYSVGRRGVLFAPVYFEPGMRERRDYRYSPAIAIDLAVLPKHLFLRPRDQHYYFGDYYDAAYVNKGFYVSFSFQSGGYGYDPIYSQQRWDNRKDPKWESNFETKYQNRRDHVNVRPPRTWVNQRAVAAGVKPGGDMPIAKPFAQLSREPGPPRQFQPIAPEQKEQFAQRSQDIHKSRDMRRTIESNPAKPGGPFTVGRPRSPIFSNPSTNEREQVPERPQRSEESGRNNGNENRNNGNERDRHER